MDCPNRNQDTKEEIQSEQKENLNDVEAIYEEIETLEENLDIKRRYQKNIQAQETEQNYISLKSGGKKSNITTEENGTGQKYSRRCNLYKMIRVVALLLGSIIIIPVALSLGPSVTLPVNQVTHSTPASTNITTLSQGIRNTSESSNIPKSSRATRYKPTSTNVTTAPIRRLLQPTIDLDLNFIRVGVVAALSDGGAVLLEEEVGAPKKVWQISPKGQTVRQIYTSSKSEPIGGLVVREPFLFILHGNGTIVKTNLSTGHIEHVYHIPRIRTMKQYSHPADSTYVNPDILLLADYTDQHIISYNLFTGSQEIKVSTGLEGPTGVYKQSVGNTYMYVVCNQRSSNVKVYTSSGEFVRQIGRNGKGDGELNYPWSAVPSPEGEVIIADMGNRRISLFSINGTFISHLYHVNKPRSLYMSHPYLWVSDGNQKVFRLKLYEH